MKVNEEYEIKEALNQIMNLLLNIQQDIQSLNNSVTNMEYRLSELENYISSTFRKKDNSSRRE
jgi:predicted  nucleic acid-binding Zn-ribbon protein